MSRASQDANVPVTVLVADDEASIRSGLEKIISLDPGMALVAVATDALEAIELARQQQPAVALLDINMPGGGGPWAAAGIRAVSPRTRVIGHSIHDDRAAVMEMVRAGVVGYIVKGAPAAEILETLRRAGSGQSTLSAEVVSTVVYELASILQLQEQQAEARRLQVAEARRLVAGEGVAIIADPIVDLYSGAVVGMAARPVLAATPARSLESALRSAESVGYRVEVEVALTSMALQRAGSLPPAGYVLVSVSPVTVLAEAFARLEEWSAGGQLVVAIDGAQPSPDDAALDAVLSRLRARGVKLAITAVAGSEHGLAHAFRLRPDVLRLDAGSVPGLGLDPAAGALVAGMWAFARAMGAELLVDGISSQEEADAARVAGARLGQGPLFRTP
ncbi:MAG: hypothetical protein NVSMB17_00540 [Candidatus Dormibacteria bacterium]